MLVAVVVGGVAGVLSLFHIIGEPPFLKSRSMVRGVADTEVLVDSERSALANADANLDALALRAGIFVQLLDAANGRRLIAGRAGIESSRLALVTYDQRTGASPTRNPTLGQRSDDIADEVLGYRIEVVTQQGLPVINISAQAPDSASAAKLANAAAEVTVQYLSRVVAGTSRSVSADQAGNAVVDGERAGLGRIRLEQLGRAVGRSVTIGGGYARGAIAGGFTFAIAVLAILFITGLRDELRARRAVPAAASYPAAPVR